MSAMVLEKKFAWKQLAPCLDPFTIAAASVTNRTVRSWCVSPCGQLIVPFVCVDCQDTAADQMIITIKSLPAIDRGEVIELAIREGVGETQNPDFFTLCLGWLLGPFVKLTKLDLSAWRGDWDRTLWMTVLRNLQRHSVALDTLHFYGCPVQALKVLPTFSSLLELSLSVHETSGQSAASLLESLADCGASLCRLHSVRFEIVCGPGDCASSLQRCLDAFPLMHIAILDDGYGHDETLARILSQIRWPSNCCMVYLEAAFPGAELLALAEKICCSRVLGFRLDHSLSRFDGSGLIASHVQEFLNRLQWSELLEFYWVPPRKLPAVDYESVRTSLCALVDNLYSLRLLHIKSANEGGFASEDLAKVAWKWGVELSCEAVDFRTCIGCCDCEFTGGGLV
ncbi:unnamed protein product [Symbiodinium sp. CCMP2456]|nr:unnamed protein product [Symbiodinium sp. CCMP2456]